MPVFLKLLYYTVKHFCFRIEVKIGIGGYLLRGERNAVAQSFVAAVCDGTPIELQLRLGLVFRIGQQIEVFPVLGKYHIPCRNTIGLRGFMFPQLFDLPGIEIQLIAIVVILNAHILVSGFIAFSAVDVGMFTVGSHCYACKEAGWYRIS